MPAPHKGWPLESMRVAQVHGEVQSTDGERCETQSGQLDRIARAIELSGELSDAQRERLITIADC